MMNYEEIKAMAEVLVNNDDAFARYKKNCIHVILNDCDSELEAWEYYNEKAVDAFMKALEHNCIQAKYNWGGNDYAFDNFVVNIRYVSSGA